MESEDLREIRIDPIVPTQSVLISTARGKRPHPAEAPTVRDVRDQVESCPFCRGNEHLTPPPAVQVPPQGAWDIRIVENLYPILDDIPLPALIPHGVQQALEGYGRHEVIVDHFNHGIALVEMSDAHIARLFGVYRDRMRFLYNADLRIKYILVFKNFGKAAGASIPHTHSQLVAMPTVPHNVEDEIQGSRDFYRRKGACIFCALIHEAIEVRTTRYEGCSGQLRQVYETGKYVVERGAEFIAIKPFASRYEWEVHILPLRHQSDFLALADDALADLGRVLKRTMARLQAVVGEVQYNYFLHTAPWAPDGSEFAPSFHWHLEICPRTSIPSGFELGSGLFVNTLSPELAAIKLRQVELGG